MANAWIAVASAAHVRIGRQAGFMQVCHGKASPLRRITPGDRVIYYSPTVVFGGKDRLQAFTAIGLAHDGAPYQVELESGFRPWRRDVDWRPAEETLIRPLLGRLAFTQVGPNWGYQLRFGLFGISNEDADMIAEAMRQERQDFSPNAAISEPSKQAPECCMA
ncbi:MULTISPECIES: EVE domain-containing protein [unclassified Rhizobium]|jgi:hypothetical protein|uniref:EVE domain-containing protein n=1 Tax=unclassified Rhizobium TaxID=2613769 RepID=UPI001A98EACB|nr:MULTISPECIES: EVE domain-containing protein [unclassified Rhizobium]MBX5172116.1 EVE domain-containing protein [Rhizobium sp. NZLR1b]MBX5205133.1 EVE domain-containing protein [Rhizobium sp. NZLR1]QSZ21275.1 EVE domain-containing protein [Rhizobium sp. NZLR1]